MRWNRPKVVTDVGLNAVTRHYEHIEVKPYAGACGAEIFGVDTSKSLPEMAIEEIKLAHLDHLVIFFRDQNITPEGLKEFGSHFGTFHIHPFAGGLEDHPEIMPVIKTPEKLYNFSETWHSDVTFDETPPMGTILGAIDIPEYRGNTMFSNQYLAYDLLSDIYKEMLEGLHAVHNAQYAYGREEY